ncbi:MAG: oligosaccharide flippase family protein [Clostridia bacterium]|nr:oligosaccharide flippase family protein [Clostridia bacterium]
MAKAQKSGKAVKAGIGYTAGNMLVKGITFLTIPLFTRLMSTESYGLFNTFNSYMAILTIFIGLALHASIKNAKYDFGEKLPAYTSSMIIIISICAAVFGVLAIVFGGGISKILGYSVTVILLMVVEAFSNSLMSLYNCVLAIDFRYKEYLGLSFFYSIGSIGASVLLITTLFGDENSYVGRILGSVIPLVLIAAYIIAKSFIKARPTHAENKEYLKYGLAISLPLIPHGLSQILLNQCDRIMIKNMIGDSEAGIYSLAYNIATLYFVLITSADTAWTPWFYERMNNNDEKGIRKNTSTYVILMSFVCIAIFIGGPWLVTVMGGEDYYSARFLIIPLIYSMFFSFLYTLPVAVEYYYKKTKSVAAATVVSAVVNVILNYVFILLFGYVAAAYTTAVCHILYFIFHMIMAKKIMGKIVFSMKNIMLCIGVVTVIGAVCLVFLDNILAFWNFVFFTPYVIIPLAALLLMGGIVAFINRKKISVFIQRMKGN